MSPIGQAGRIRLSPLKQAVASSKQGTTATASPTDDVGGAVDNEQGEMPHATELPEGVTPEQVATAQQLAAQGDQDAIDWLKIIGIGAGVVGTGVAGTALYKALRNKNTKTPKAAPMHSTSVSPKAPSQAVAVVPPARPQLENVPVTQLRDEHLVHPLPNPKEARALQNALRALRRVR